MIDGHSVILSAIELMQVSNLITASFNVAKAKHQSENGRWVSLSHKLGGAASIPMLAVSIQRAGDFDLVLRCMEDELANAKASGDSQALEGQSFHYLKVISEMWVSSCYEFLRTIRQRESEAEKADLESKRHSLTPEFKALFTDLELLRMPMEKHEIAKDRELEAPLIMQRYPPRGDETDRHVYDSSDPRRTHIMPTSLSDRGSLMWQVLDHRLDREYWVERRDIGDRLLALVDILPVNNPPTL